MHMLLIVYYRMVLSTNMCNIHLWRTKCSALLMVKCTFLKHYPFHHLGCDRCCNPVISFKVPKNITNCWLWKEIMTFTLLINACLTALLCNWEFPASNFEWRLVIPTGFHSFPHSLQTNAQTVPQIVPWTIHCTLF